MWLSVMTIFIAYAAIFILFEDYDRKFIMPFNEVSDWHLLLFSLVVMGGLGFMLYRYAKRMDERISREQAEKENRMRRELTQNIAHELKTPVASILGYTDTILDSADMPEETRLRFIERTNAQARRLTALLQDISTLNRMDYAKDLITMERVDVAVLFADIVQETAIAMQARQMSMRNYLPQSIIIHGNYSLLYSIFRNLVDNAISYAGQGTTVEVWAEQQPDCWRFTFRDNGIGIEAPIINKLFDPFFTTKPTSEATGIGLYICREIIQNHHGSISIRSEKGEYTEVIVTLPLLKD